MVDWPGTPAGPQQWPGTPASNQQAAQWPGTPAAQAAAPAPPAGSPSVQHPSVNTSGEQTEDPSFTGQMSDQWRKGTQAAREGLFSKPEPGAAGGVANVLGTARGLGGIVQAATSPLTGAIRSYGGRGLQTVDELMRSGAEKLYGKERVEKAAGPPKTFSQEADEAEKVSMVAPGIGFGGHTGQGAQAARNAFKVLEKIVSPETVDHDARAAAATIRELHGMGARDTATTERALEPGWKTINKMSPQDQLDLTAYVEGRGRAAAAPLDPAARDVADTMRTAFEQRMRKLQALPAHQQQAFIDDYFPHFWKDPAKAQAATVTGGGAGRQGSGASLKARSIPTIADGIAAGLEPITTNPLEATMRYVTSMDRFIASEAVMQTGKDQNVIRYVRPQVMGASGHPESFKVPPGYAPLNGRGARNAAGAQAYAPEGWARVYNNFISRGIGEVDPAYGDAYEVARRGANAITGMELGLSGYHALTMMQEGMVNNLANAIGYARKGMPLEAGRSLAKTPGAPVQLAMKGKKVQDVYLGLSPGTRDLQKVTDLLTRAGGRAKGAEHAPDYNFSKAGSYVTALKRGALKIQLAADAAEMRQQPILGTAKVAGRHIGRIMSTVAQPLFEKYIPLIKNGAFYENMSAWMKTHPTAGPDEELNAARQIWDSIDNRFGEMVSDNVFMNKVLKQAGMLGLRSWSWAIGGDIREIGGGLRDVARAPFKRPTGTGPQDERWTSKMDYVIALPIVYAGLSALYQGLKTGKPPESLQDLMAPQTGGVDANTGEPERLIMPGYMKDVFGFAEPLSKGQLPVQEVANKVGTGPKMVGQLMSNRDWRDDPIFNANDSAPQWLKQFWDYAVSNVGPISVRDVARGRKEGTDLNRVEQMLGVRTAPRYLTDPEGYEQMMRSIHGRQWQQKLRHDRKQEQLYGSD